MVRLVKYRSGSEVNVQGGVMHEERVRWEVDGRVVLLDSLDHTRGSRDARAQLANDDSSRARCVRGRYVPEDKCGSSIGDRTECVRCSHVLDAIVIQPRAR